MQNAYGRTEERVNGKPLLLALSKATRRRYLLFIIMVAPAFLLRLSTAAAPILQTIYLSFTNLSILRGTNEFVGIQNYGMMVNDYGVRSAFIFTILYVVSSAVLQLIIGMLIALLLNASFRGRAFARTMLYRPTFARP